MVIYFPLSVLINRTETNVGIVYMVHSSKKVHVNNYFKNLLICHFFSKETKEPTMKQIQNSCKNSYHNEENKPPRAKVF